MHLYDFIHPNEILFSTITAEKLLVGSPCRDTRTLAPRDVFFCTDGERESGFSHLGEAIHHGASAIVTEKGGACRAGRLGIPVIEVENPRAAFARAYSRFAGEPQKDMTLLAVTGTNGKTSTAHFTAELLRFAGFVVGEIGTVAYFDGKETLPSAYTTPPPEELYPLLSRMRQNGCQYVIMEASSHALAQERLFGLSFACGIFTNLSRDHMDYHKTWEAYRSAKAKLFASCEKSLINGDDAEAKEMGFSASGEVYYYGKTDKNFEFTVENPEKTADALQYTLCYEGERIAVTAHLAGDFNISNTAAALGAARLLGVPSSLLSERARHLTPPAGRLERLTLEKGDFAVYIDYAHTPDALEKAITALRPLCKYLTVLFGAGGDRDKGKRAEMGHIAEENADFVIVTSDNPRSEAPEAILADILSGMKKENHTVIADRRAAIEYAVHRMKAGELLLLAGKGHEKTLTDRFGKHRFSEREIVQNIGKG